MLRMITTKWVRTCSRAHSPIPSYQLQEKLQKETALTVQKIISRYNKATGRPKTKSIKRRRTRRINAQATRLRRSTSSTLCPACKTLKISTHLTTTSMEPTLITLVICLRLQVRRTVGLRYIQGSMTTCNSRRCVAWETFQWVQLLAFLVKCHILVSQEQVDTKDMFQCQVGFRDICVKQPTLASLCHLVHINREWML